MNRYDELARHWEWADRLWAIVRESTSDEDFAEKLAAFSVSVSAAVASGQGFEVVGDNHKMKMNGTTLPHFTSAADTVLPPPPLDQDPSGA